MSSYAAALDGKMKDEARKLLHEFKGEVQQLSRESDVLFEESMKHPQEPHACGQAGWSIAKNLFRETGSWL